MKIFPYYTAPAGTVEWSTPRLECHDEVIEPGGTFKSWDYLSQISVSLDFVIDSEMLAKEIVGPSGQGHDRESCLVTNSIAMLQVECSATQYRQVVDCGLPSGRKKCSLSLTIPAGFVAKEITLTAAVVLRSPVPGAGPLVPSMAGSRLVIDEPRWKVALEGAGSAFPVSAFDFKGTGYPEGALWYLDMQPDRLTDPFASVVRLLVNTGHPRSAEVVASGGRGDLHEIVHYDVLATMLEAAAALPENELRAEFDDGTLGSTLAELADLYLGQSLGDVANRINNDLPDFRAELQRAVGFLSGNERGE